MLYQEQAPTRISRMSTQRIVFMYLVSCCLTLHVCIIISTGKEEGAAAKKEGEEQLAMSHRQSLLREMYLNAQSVKE